MNRLSCKCLLLCFLTNFAGLAANHEKLSNFEKAIVDLGLKKYGLEIDKSPEGKKIRNFYFYTEEAFDQADPLLNWVNKLQFETKDSALRSQLWIEPGDTYHANILVQNEQALLNPAVRSFILIFPVQKTAALSETQVDLLIVSKDVFSWQGTYSIAGTGDTLNQFSLGFAQTNLLGLNKTVGLNFTLNQALFGLSAYYTDPSLFSTKNQLSVQQGFLFDRKDFHYVGFSGAFKLSYPLIIESVPWGYTASLTYNSTPVYDFQGNQIRLYQGYERKYKQLQVLPSFTLTRSLGTKYKNNFSFGYGLHLGKYEAMEAVSPEFIQNILPTSELQSFLILGYRYFQNQYLALYDYDTFSMTEWAQLGPSLDLLNHIGLSPLGSDNSFFKPTLSFSMTASLSKTGLVQVSAGGQTRIQNGAINNQSLLNLLTIFPSIPYAGRFIFAVHYAQTWNNQNNLRYTLGSTSGLRGVPYQYYQGTQLLQSNLEFRTLSVPFWIFRFGLAAFYDFGAAFKDEQDFNPTHDIGLGLRILTIPWNRLLIRIDAATPIVGPLTGFQNTLITFGVGQAF